MKELIEKVIQWQKDRNFFGEGGATLEMQTLKFFEEYGEYCKNKVRGLPTIDDIGDMMVVNLALLSLRHSPERVDIEYLTMKRKSIGFDPSFFWGGHVSANYYGGYHALVKLAEDEGYTAEECLSHAYEEIKDRKGKFINGTFIKQSDL